MKVRSFILILLTINLMFGYRASASQQDHQISIPEQAPLSKQAALNYLAQAPLGFERKRANGKREAEFIARSQGAQLVIGANSATFMLPPKIVLPANKFTGKPTPKDGQSQTISAGSSIQLQLFGTQANPVPQTGKILPEKINYFVGADPKQWRRDVSQFERVRYQGIYKGIDWVWYGTHNEVEYDFVIYPHADPSQIRFSLTGQNELTVNQQGDLMLNTPSGAITQRKPVAYQLVEGKRKFVSVTYQISNSQEISFAIGAYDSTQELVIDPVLVYSSYFGGDTGNDYVRAMTVDQEGNIYLTGTTDSINYPVRNAAQDNHRTGGGCCDAFVTKLSPTGIVFSTYLGSTFEDYGNAIAIDKNGNVTVTGSTQSPDFPTTRGALSLPSLLQDQAFVTQLDGQGNLLFSTLLGGGGKTFGYGVTSDSANNIYVTGTTRAPNFPTVNAYQSEKDMYSYEVFVTKLDPTGSGIIYSTLLGGNGDEGANAIRVDAAGNMYVAGATASSDFPTLKAIQDYWVVYVEDGTPRPDVFVTKINADGQSLAFSTYLGSYREDWATDLTLDKAGNIYLTGNSDNGLAGETDIPARSYSSAKQALINPFSVGRIFALKLNPTGDVPLFVNYFGNKSYLYGGAIAADDSGYVYLTGTIESPQRDGIFNVTADALQTDIRTFSHTVAFFTILDSNQSGASAIKYSTIISGSDRDEGIGVALDGVGNVYVAGNMSSPVSSEDPNFFPIRNPPYKSYFGVGTRIFLAKFAPVLSSVTGTNPDTQKPQVTINAPTSSPTYSTTEGRISISGTATDNIGVKTVCWANGIVWGSKATGTNNWSIPNLDLQSGKNIITVTAADGAGNVGSATITIHYQPEYIVESYAGYSYNGNLLNGFTGDGGSASVAYMRSPITVATDAVGNVYVADFDGSTIRKVTPDGIIRRVVGNYQSGYSGDNGPAINGSLVGTNGIVFDSQGNLFFADGGNHRVRKVDTNGHLTTIAGSGPAYPTYTPGNDSGDGGPAIQAEMKGPSFLAFDKAGSLLIVDTDANKIRKVTTVGIITTFAGTGARVNSGDGGLATQSSLSEPRAIAVDPAGNVYVVVQAAQGGSQIRKISTDGIISHFAGNGRQGFTDTRGNAKEVTFNGGSMAFDSTGNMYLTDYYWIRRINTEGIIETIAGQGEYVGRSIGDGDAAISVQLSAPSGIAVDPRGAIYFAERSGHRIRRLVPGRRSDATAPVVTFDNPPPTRSLLPTLSVQGTAKDNEHVLQVKWKNDRGGSGAALGILHWQVDQLLLQPGLNTITVTATDIAGNQGEAKFTIEYQADTSVPTVSITNPSTTNAYTSPTINPVVKGAVTDNVGIVEMQWHNDRGQSGYVSLTGNNWQVEQLILREGINNLTLTATDAAGNQGIAKISLTYTPDLLLYTLAGGGNYYEIGGIGDGGAANQAVLQGLSGYTIDPQGNYYLTTGSNNTIRKITPDGVINTILTGLRSPAEITSDALGNIYFVELTGYRIQKLTPQGQLSTVVGNGTYGQLLENVPAPETPLGSVGCLRVDAAGNIFLSDISHHRIFKVSAATGMMTRIAGTGVSGYSGDGGLAQNAQLSSPWGICFDQAGNLYVAENDNQTVRRIGTDGIIQTIAGLGMQPGFSGDGGPAVKAKLLTPSSVAVDAAGNLYISEIINRCIRRVRPDGTISTIAGITPIAPNYADTGKKVLPAASAIIYSPVNLLINAKGDIVFMENDGGRIRAITPIPVSNFAVTSVSAASYINAPSSPESIVAAFGNSLATGAYPALRVPLATNLGGTTVKIKDSSGLERLAPLFYVSPGQVNYQVPYGTALGNASVTVTSSDGKTSNGSLQISTISPGIFSATSDGAGWAAANVQRVKADGSQVFEPVVRYDTQQNKFVPVPINLSNANEQAYLVLFGTGIRYRNSLMNVTAKIAGLEVPVEYAGPQGAYVGVDQINLKIPNSFAGKGDVDITVTVEGKMANIVRVNLK